MKIIAAGIIIKENQILVCQRKRNSYYGLKWEFPGGKVEENESIEECLFRELKEELNIEITIDSHFYTEKHRYPDGFEFEIHFFIINKFSGIVLNKVFEKIEWSFLRDLDKYDFLEADKAIIEKLINCKIQVY